MNPAVKTKEEIIKENNLYGPVIDPSVYFRERVEKAMDEWGQQEKQRGYDLGLQHGKHETEEQVTAALSERPGMKWKQPDDFPKETGEQLCEVIQRPNDSGSMGGTSIYPTYVRFVVGDTCWLNPPEGYKVHRWLSDEPPQPKEGEAFAIGFAEWVGVRIWYYDAEQKWWVKTPYELPTTAELFDIYKSSLEKEGKKI